MARVGSLSANVGDPVAAARASGLEYVTDGKPGISRRRLGGAFVYRTARGRRVRDPRELKRIRGLVIPPAWTDVWICPSSRGHIQATGRDARGRKQYRYHPRWRAVRDETKFSRMVAFARILPRLRARVARDLALPGLPRAKVLATVVRLLETTYIRIGNEEYARQNASFGLTTLRGRHVSVNGSTVHFRFRGKSGKDQEVALDDARVARVIRRCRDLTGQDLFKYLDADGARQTIGSSDVNAYLRDIAGDEFTAKDFRTWAGTVLAALALRRLHAADSSTQAKRNIVRAIAETAGQLGNTPAVCRKCYVHPAVLDAYLGGVTLDTVTAGAKRRASRGRRLRAEEAGVVMLLERWNSAETELRKAS
jgi:DNA topoisomerase-1